MDTTFPTLTLTIPEAPPPPKKPSPPRLGGQVVGPDYRIEVVMTDYGNGYTAYYSLCGNKSHWPMTFPASVAPLLRPDIEAVILNLEQQVAWDPRVQAIRKDEAATVVQPT